MKAVFLRREGESIRVAVSARYRAVEVEGLAVFGCPTSRSDRVRIASYDGCGWTVLDEPGKTFDSFLVLEK